MLKSASIVPELTEKTPSVIISLHNYIREVYEMDKAKKKILFVSCNGLIKNRVGRSVKKYFLHYFFGHKCVFYACFMLIGSWEGLKNFRVGINLNKNLLG